MKTQLVQSNPSNTPVINSQTLALQEQLALKRLKELELEVEELRSPKRSWLWQVPATIWVALFRRAELTRGLAPGQLPTQWEEIEELRAQRAMQLR